MILPQTTNFTILLATSTHIWKLIRLLQQEEAAVSAVIARDSVGEPPKKKTKRVYVDLQQRPKNLCKDYTEGRKTLDQMLCGLGHNIRF